METTARKPSRTASTSSGNAPSTSGRIHHTLTPPSAKFLGRRSTGPQPTRRPMKIIAPRPTSAASTTTPPKTRLPFQMRASSTLPSLYTSATPRSHSGGDLGPGASASPSARGRGCDSNQVSEVRPTKLPSTRIRSVWPVASNVRGNWGLSTTKAASAFSGSRKMSAKSTRPRIPMPRASVRECGAPRSKSRMASPAAPARSAAPVNGSVPDRGARSAKAPYATANPTSSATRTPVSRLRAAPGASTGARRSRPSAKGRNALHGKRAWPSWRTTRIEGVLRGRPLLDHEAHRPGERRVGDDREERAHPEAQRHHAHHQRGGARGVAFPRSIRLGLRAAEDNPREADRQRRHGHAQDQPAREEPRHQPDDPDDRPEELAAHVEQRAQEAAEGDGERAHGDDVAEHGARLHEVERHGGEGDGRVEAGAAVDQPRQRLVEDRHPREAPHRERQAPRPVVQPEELEAHGHGGERQLPHAQVGEGREAVQSAGQIERGRAEDAQGDPPGQVGRVELVGVPDPAPGEDGKQHQRGDPEREEAVPIRARGGLAAGRARRVPLCAGGPARLGAGRRGVLFQAFRLVFRACHPGFPYLAAPLGAILARRARSPRKGL